MNLFVFLNFEVTFTAFVLAFPVCSFELQSVNECTLVFQLCFILTLEFGDNRDDGHVVKSELSLSGHGLHASRQELERVEHSRNPDALRQRVWRIWHYQVCPLEQRIYAKQQIVEPRHQPFERGISLLLPDWRYFTQ